MYGHWARETIRNVISTRAGEEYEGRRFMFQDCLDSTKLGKLIGNKFLVSSILGGVFFLNVNDLHFQQTRRIDSKPEKKHYIFKHIQILVLEREDKIGFYNFKNNSWQVIFTSSSRTSLFQSKVMQAGVES